ncbi:MAG: protease SohB [Pseudobdellovibrionaceae bacterium]
MSEVLVSGLINLATFFGQALIIVVAVAAILLLIAMLIAKSQMKSDLEIKDLNEQYEQLQDGMKSFVLSKDALKKEHKAKKKEAKKKANEEKKNRLFVVDFDGDVKASQVEELREEVTAILSVATPEDEVLLRLESPGGIVHGYGLAAAQLLRLRDKNVKLTVAVDQVAASGGYMMACTANQIIAAPFGILGSIGVVASVPNFNRLLKKHDVTYKEYIAGDYKRTVSVLGEITEKGEKKFQEQLEDTHLLFKEFISQFRPQLNMAVVATGEYWFGKQALKLSLIDDIKTSDDYIFERITSHQILEVSFRKKKGLGDKVSQFMGHLITNLFEKLLSESKKAEHSI